MQICVNGLGVFISPHQPLTLININEQNNLGGIYNIVTIIKREKCQANMREITC
jgi:hypothetical protein